MRMEEYNFGGACQGPILRRMLRLQGAIAAFLLGFGAFASTGRLPLRHYTSADGLVRDHVTRMALDPEGFLWIATVGGLSRFDGERFAAFGEAEGLRGRSVNDVAIAADGTHWVATERGLFWFRPGETPADARMFRPLALAGVPESDEPFRLLAGRSGTLWVGTLRRLWRVDGGAPDWRVSPVDLHRDHPGPIGSRVQCLREDPAGAIWVGTHLHGIFRVRPDGGVDHCPRQTSGAFFVRDFHFPGDGSVWTAYLGGVARFERPPFPGQPSALIGREEGLSIDTQGLLANGDGGVLVATTVGISDVRRSATGAWQVGPTLDRRSGLPGDFVGSLLRDPQGNLWASLAMRGIVKLPRGAFSGLPEAEEPGAAIMDLAVDRRGGLVALASRGATRLTALSVRDLPSGWFPVSLPASAVYVGWGGSQKLLADSHGSWWVATGAGVLRFADDGRAGARCLSRQPDARFGLAEGLPGDDAYIVAEDARGDVWMSVQPTRPGASSLSRWTRDKNKVETFSAAETGTPALAGRFQGTRDGSMWMLFLDQRLVRYRNGSFQTVPLDSGPEDELLSLHEDATGRLWLFGRAAFVCDHPAADEPRFERHPIAEGYALRCMVEDADARIWFGTDQGVLRYDPAASEQRRFTVEDGLGGNFISLCARDGAGTLWFSDQYGLSRLERRPERPAHLPKARVRDVRIAGEVVPLPANGTTLAGRITIPADRRRVSVEYFAVHHGPGPPPRFQYRLEGADAEWSAPTSDRSVQYAHLAPGRYRFLVRTIGEEGTPSDAPASVPLRLLAPIWQQAWFLGLCAGAAGALGYAGYRLRVRRAVAFERIRTRIATDLHDDIGSSLSQISILSQLAHRQAAEAGGRPPVTLERITALSGELIDAMSDVVWAISPRSDTVAALVHRMRRFASELFADGAAELKLTLPDGDEAPVDPDVRRQLYMVFKESLHNVRRHAAARRVSVELRRESGGWALCVEDDGRGFDTRRESEGHGLRSMRRRAERLGGTLTLRSSGQGTRLELTLPGKARTNLSNR
jgi:signal transduction histidine kinase/ligand-binding sensor domain-containing protein